MARFLAISLLILGLALSENVWARSVAYPLPPPNDTSLNAAQPSVQTRHYKHRHRVHRRVHHRVHHRLHVCSYHHYRHRHHHRRHYAHRKPTLYLYYSLPGTACCGETWELRKTRKGAEYGVWPNSPYATFEPAPDDFIYSATNDDDSRYDPYRESLVDDTIENPD